MKPERRPVYLCFSLDFKWILGATDERDEFLLLPRCDLLGIEPIAFEEEHNELAEPARCEVCMQRYAGSSWIKTPEPNSRHNSAINFRF